MIKKGARWLLRRPFWQKRMREMYTVPPFRTVQYDEDGMVTNHIPGFLEDPDYQAAHAAGASTGAWETHPMRWRVHVALWAAKQASFLDGDFVECGVDKGGLSRAICELLDFTNQARQFWLIDSFEPIDLSRVHSEEKAINANLTHEYGGTYEQVQKSFAPYSNVNIVKGFIPEALEAVSAKKVAYLSIDLNNINPEMDAIAYFWDRMVPGGIVLLDDYAIHRKFEVQRRGWDAWAKEQEVPILNGGTGQGIIIKPQTT